MDHRELIQAGYRYALSLCHDPSDARDLVQEGWTRVAQRYPEANRGLLFTTIRHLWIDERRRPRLVMLDGERAAAVAGADHADRGALRGDLADALAELNPEEREAIFLALVEGYTADEIAYQTGRSRNTILSQIRRGKDKLRTRLGDTEPDREMMS
jgi:RNA polymerase sigma-70 factor (ECF subfamily)